MKKKITGTILTVFFAAAYWGCQKQPALPDLQRKCLLAKTEEAKAAVVAELEQYYYSLPVLKSLRERVEREVTAQIDTTKIIWVEDRADTNAYRREGRLPGLLTLVAIAHAREETSTFQNLLAQARLTAQAVDMGTQNDYWVPLVEKFARNTKEAARAWLKAKKAEELCRALQNEKQFLEAEAYAAFGLKLLPAVEDQRLRLDFFQRLLWILYEHHSHYDLVNVFSEKVFAQAENIKFHFRATGFLYARAEARRKMGQNQAALELFRQICARVENYKSIPNVQWYLIHSTLRIGDIQKELGEFEKALEACRMAEKYSLGPAEAIMLELLQFNVFLASGYYEQADTALHQATQVAIQNDRISDLIQCLNNRGVLCSRLADDDSALVYYQRARSYFTKSSLDLEMRLKVLANIAGILATKKDSVQFEGLVNEAQNLLRLIDSPGMKASLLHNIGVWYQLDKRYARALQYFKSADSIAAQNELSRFVITIRMDMADCLIALERFSEARALTAATAPLAQELDALEAEISVLDRTVQIQYRTRDYDQALENSKILLAKIEAMSRRFKSADRLIAYRHKIYDLLKSAALCDIAKQQNEAAFATLVEAKAYALQNRLISGGAPLAGLIERRSAFKLETLLPALGAKQVLLDYMITPDTLYLFVVTSGRVRLLRKGIKLEHLHTISQAYRDTILKTLPFFENYEASMVRAHYAGAAKLAEQLHKTLLSWREPAATLQQAEMLYIVPDEFLFEIPFAALLAEAGDAKTFLANQAACLILPSAGLLARANAANGVVHSRKTLKVLISADLRFAEAAKFVSFVKALFPRAEELALPSHTISKEAVLTKLKEGHQVYLFLGHGRANTANPNEGYIELTIKTSATEQQRMRLTTQDLKSINWLDTDLVMLIGCETAHGRLFRGTGISGLQQEFLALGAKNVLGNLWEVEADHAIEQAQNLLRLWAASWEPALALQKSQHQALKAMATDPYYQYPHPYFWGSMVLLTSVSHNKPIKQM